MAGSQGLHAFSGEPPLFSQLKGDITIYAFSLQKDGKAKSTIRTRMKKLTQLAKMCNLNNPEEVKETLAKLPLQNSTKKSIASIYHDYCKHKGLQWKKPKYTPQEKLPFIPTEQEIDQLIASMGKTTAALLQILKETGIRIGEAHSLKWLDYDQQTKTLNITPEKGSKPRILPISEKLRTMLNNLSKNRDTIFMKNHHTQRNLFDKQRKTATEKLGNPRIQRISFHTLRHWKATTEYHKTKDIIHVQQLLGHKDIKSTMIYINIENSIYKTQTDEYTVKTAKTPEEATKLIEIGFEYITEIDGTRLFRKRK